MISRNLNLYQTESVTISKQSRKLLFKVAANNTRRLENNYHPGFGIFPSADPNSNYYNQVWSRDLAHAGGNYFATANPIALQESLATILRHQKENGSLPSRVEREYEIVKFIPILRRWSKPIFNLIEVKFRGRIERPVYEGQDGAGGEDTIPAILIGIGELFMASKEGCQFVKEHFDQLNRAVNFFRTKTDPADGLAIMTRSNPDWADTITRKGKLGGINVWWARSLRLMEYMARNLGRKEDAAKYLEEFMKVKKSVLSKLYNRSMGYFQAEEHDARLDTVATIFGTLYLLRPHQALGVEEVLNVKMDRPAGLQNFAPPYPKQDVFWFHRLLGQWRYHNKNVWPWVTCENIQVMIKIARQHPVEAIRWRYKRKAIETLLQMARLFEKEGAGEVFDPDSSRPAKTIFYAPPKDFMGSMTAYQGAFFQLKKLAWI